MNAYKRYFIYALLGVLLFDAGYYFGSRADISGDGAGIDRALDDLRAAGQQAETAGSALDSAGGAIDDAAGTAGDVEKTNQQLADGNAEAADLIGRGKSILADIRGRGEEGT